MNLFKSKIVFLIYGSWIALFGAIPLIYLSHIGFGWCFIRLGTFLRMALPRDVVQPMRFNTPESVLKYVGFALIWALFIFSGAIDAARKAVDLSEYPIVYFCGTFCFLVAMVLEDLKKYSKISLKQVEEFYNQKQV